MLVTLHVLCITRTLFLLLWKKLRSRVHACRCLVACFLLEPLGSRKSLDSSRRSSSFSAGSNTTRRQLTYELPTV